MITKATREKMLETKQSKNGIILKQNGIDITADAYQYILNMKKYNTTFHVTLANLFEEVYERKEKEDLLKSKDKSVEGIIKTVEKTHKWLRKILKPLDGVTVTLSEPV